MFNLAIIRSEDQYAEALAEVERLWNAEPGSPEGDRRDLVVTLIEKYEDEVYPMDPPDPIEAIKFRMEQEGLKRKEIEPIFGSRSRTSEVLGRKRSLSIAMIRGLTKRFGISADILIRPTQIVPAPGRAMAKAFKAKRKPSFSTKPKAKRQKVKRQSLATSADRLQR